MRSPLRNICLLALLPLCLAAAAPAQGANLAELIGRVQPKIVKIFGAGGYHGLEAYQSGLLISPEGHVLTVFSYVLVTDEIGVILHDGHKFKARLLGADPRLEVAVLKIDATDLPAFDLDAAPEADAGTRVLAFSNLFGVATGNEPVSVQQGTIAVRTDLDARRGTYQTPYRGPIYVLDVTTNNPGAAGGALVDRQGRLLGMLGKELRNAQNNTWLNYAIPIASMRQSVAEIRAGKFVARDEGSKRDKPARSASLVQLGVVLVPDVLPRTPPYVDQIVPGSLADRAGLRPDDLVMLVGDHLVQSCKALSEEMEYVDFEDQVKLTVLRGQDLVEVTLRAEDRRAESKGP